MLLCPIVLYYPSWGLLPEGLLSWPGRLSIVSTASWQKTKGIVRTFRCGILERSGSQRSSSLYFSLQCCGLESEVHGCMTAAGWLTRLSTQRPGQAVA